MTGITMKAFSAAIQENEKIRFVSTGRLIPALASNIRKIMALAYAFLTAAMVITSCVFVAGLEINTFLEVSTWGMGFIFLAMAVDSEGLHAKLQAVTGIALLAIALLQNLVAPDFFFVTGTLLASWLAFAVFKRLTQ